MLESKVGKSLKPYSFPRSTFFGCLKHDQFTSVASVSIHISSYLWSHHAPHLCVPHPDPPKVSQSPIPMASEAFWNPDLIFLSQGFVFGSFNITWGAVFGHVSVFFLFLFFACVWFVFVFLLFVTYILIYLHGIVAKTSWRLPKEGFRHCFGEIFWRWCAEKPKWPFCKNMGWTMQTLIVWLFWFARGL